MVGRKALWTGGTASIFTVENGGSLFLSNNGIRLGVHTALQPSRKANSDITTSNFCVLLCSKVFL